MRLASCIALALALIAAPAAAQDFSKVQIKVTPLRGGTHLLTGAGGNIVASVGEDGAFIIDDQYAPLSEKIQAALEGWATSRSASSSTRTGTATTPAATRRWARRAP